MATKKATLPFVIKIRVIPDEAPDLSRYGEYSQTPGPEDRTIDRRGHGYMSGEYPYFIAAMSGEQTGNPDSVRQDYERMEAYNRGEWGMLGIRAEADIVVSHTLQTIKSPGLWSVESDSGSDEFRQIADEQVEELKSILAEMGIKPKKIAVDYRELDRW